MKFLPAKTAHSLTCSRLISAGALRLLKNGWTPLPPSHLILYLVVSMNRTIAKYTVANIGLGFAALALTWTNLGPMTTNFTQPWACSQRDTNKLNVLVSGTTYAPCHRPRSLDIPAPSGFPSSRQGLWDPPKPTGWKSEEQAKYYEPGFYCPKDWSSYTLLS